MRKCRFADEQMVVILREADRDPIAAAAKKHGVSEQSIYKWRRRFSAMLGRRHQTPEAARSGERAAEEACYRARSRDPGDKGDQYKKW